MGNQCPSCSIFCGPSSSNPRRHSKFLDDDWADEIWYDALSTHDDDYKDHEHGVTFDVTEEELQILRKDLKEQFPDQPDYFSDAYLRSVASKPYSQDMSIRRPLEYTMEKLVHVLQWRHEMQASESELRIQYCQQKQDTTFEDSSLDSTWKQRSKKMVDSLNTGSMYWHGLDKDGRPILWIRTDRKFWYPNVHAEVDALIAMADAGIRYGMKGDVTDFLCISHSHNPPPPHPPFAYAMLRGLVKGYPDRLHLLISAPVSSIVEVCMNLLLPLMPGRLAHKFSFYSLEHVQTRLKTLLWHGESDIPTFLGGPVNHDQWYPVHSTKSGGRLSFDWDGMIERLQQASLEFQKTQNE